MTTLRWSIPVAVLAIVSACTSGDAVETSSSATAATEPSDSSAETTLARDRTTSEATDPASETTAARSDDTPDDDAAGPATTGATSTTSTTSTSNAPAARAGGGDADDDPSFELGPDVVLDIDIARFPVDDAGLGGGLPATTVGAPAAPTGWAGFDAALEAELIRPGNTAAAVAVSIDGDIVHSGSFGVRNPATGDRSADGDRFRIASISKTITAIVALQLVEGGVIGLDDPVGQRVADHIGLGPVGPSANLTLRQLLSHRTGFGKYDTAFFRGGAVDCADAARQGLSSGAAGGGYVYSNMNYCVAGLAIEALTGLSYEQAVYENLLTPLGISGMRLAPTFDPGPGETQHVSTLGRNYMETLGAAGQWVASPTDLVTIMDSLDTSTPGFKPLDDLTVLQMVVPFGGQMGQRGYGLGMISYGGGRFGHTGTIESTHAMLLNRGDGVTWAVTVAGQIPDESTRLEQIVNSAFVAGGFVAG